MEIAGAGGWARSGCDAPRLVGRDGRGIWHMDIVRRAPCMDVSVLRSLTDPGCAGLGEIWQHLIRQEHIWTGVGVHGPGRF